MGNKPDMKQKQRTYDLAQGAEELRKMRGHIGRVPDKFCYEDIYMHINLCDSMFLQTFCLGSYTPEPYHLGFLWSNRISNKRGINGLMQRRIIQKYVRNDLLLGII